VVLIISYIFTHTGNNRAKAGFFDAITLVTETDFAVNALIAVMLNLIIKNEEEGEETITLAGDETHEDETN
jgi:NCS2 family nucleobase:cation symporter-2